MSLQMTREERETFLAGVHVGVISIAEPARAALSAPIWYDYEPDRGVWIITEKSSRKGRLLESSGRYALVAQNEEGGYKYVSVEGPVVDVVPADDETHRRPMAHRYFGRELGDHYVDSQPDAAGSNYVYVMRPERWLSVDYTKLAGL